jgi:hypothetical protein
MKLQYIDFYVQWYHFEHEALCKEAEAKKRTLDKSTSKEEVTNAVPAKKLKAELALRNTETCGKTYDDEDSCNPYNFLASDDDLPGPEEDGKEVVVL